MQQILILSCVLIALVTAWSLVRASRTGRISSRVWTFQRDESPVGFWFIAIIDLGIVVACLGFALHALGPIGDLPTSMTIQLPVIKSCADHRHRFDDLMHYLGLSRHSFSAATISAAILLMPAARFGPNPASTGAAYASALSPDKMIRCVRLVLSPDKSSKLPRLGSPCQVVF